MPIYLIKRKSGYMNPSRHRSFALLCHGKEKPRAWSTSGNYINCPPVVFTEKQKALAEIEKLKKQEPNPDRYYYCIKNESRQWWVL